MIVRPLLVCLSLLALAGVPAAEGATLRVCASGCAFTGLQAAIDAAVPGDTILLRAGETFVGPFVLRRKAASTQWITIRSDASDTLLPADGVRLVPSGKTGANTSRSLLPRLLGQGGALKTTPVIRTEAGAHHYILKFLEVDGSANLGFETLIVFGQDTTATPAADIVVDRVYAHGHPYKGMKRGITLNSARTDILNSYISDIKAVNADSQAIAGYNGSGPFRIINNFLEGAGENILFGGADPAVSNLVPSNIEVRRNSIYKPLSWRNPILAKPGSPAASASSTTGALAGTTHYFRVVALMYTDSRTAVSLPSAAVSVAVSSGKSASIRWTGVSGADRYRIYRGSSATSQSVYMETTSAVTSFTYTGVSEKSGTPPTAGTKWTVKNLFELKNAQYVTLDGNILENNWMAGQYGYALVLTPRNEYGGATWVRVRDVTITNNIVRNVSGVLQLSGYDAIHPSQQTKRITLRNNLFYDIGPKPGEGSAKAYLMGEAPLDVTLDHNTLIHTNTSVVYAYGTEVVSGFVYTNNISLHGTYGIMGEGGRPGQYTIDKFFPSSTIKNNALAGGSASAYPTPNSFPTVTEWNASFADMAGDDYRLRTSSPFYSAGAGGTVPGADIGKVNDAIGGSTPPDDEDPGDDPGTANTPPTARPGGPYTAQAGSSINADGTASSDAEGTIAAYRWAWGDDVLINAADVPATAVKGTRWVRAQPSGAAGGWALHNPNKGEGKISTALSAPSSYVDVSFYAAAGVPYRMWFRMRAESDYYGNDSMFVQFSGSVDAQGRAVNRIGSTSAAIVILEEGSGAGVAGWGWNDSAYGGTEPAAPVYFATSGIQTVRVQQREDGIMWDQLVLSAVTYANRRPGETHSDDHVVPASFGTSSTAIATHAYQAAGVYPLLLTVADSGGLVDSGVTTVTVSSSGSTPSTVVADAGGPYSGVEAQAVRFDATGSSVPAGTTGQYRWTFGDEIVIDASMLAPAGSRWRTVADTSAATGKALENPEAGDAKLSAASASPSSYIEASFRAAPGVPYRLWLRMRAAGDSYANDSVFVQFSGSVTSSGSAMARIGTTGALAVVLEEGKGAGVGGWGWADASYGGLAAPLYFNTGGVQTVRIQQREDGLRIDQIVLSAEDHFAGAPGAKKYDTTIVPVFGAGSTGVIVEHVYGAPGTYPVTLTLDAGSTGVVTDTTTAVIK